MVPAKKSRLKSIFSQGSTDLGDSNFSRIWVKSTFDSGEGYFFAGLIEFCGGGDAEIGHDSHAVGAHSFDDHFGLCGASELFCRAHVGGVLGLFEFEAALVLLLVFAEFFRHCVWL